MYASLSDLERRFGNEELAQLSDRSAPPSGVVDPTVVDEAIETASSEIDSYIQLVYPRPLTVVPPRLVNLCCDIARYYLYTHAAPEIVVERYKAAVAFLQRVAAGDATIGLPNRAPDEHDLVQLSTGRRVFARGDRRRGNRP